MTPKERQSKPEQRPINELEQHLLGLRKTENEIREMRIHTRMGKSGIHGIMPSSMHEGEYGRYSFAESARTFSRKLSPRRDKDVKMYAEILGAVPSMIDSIEAADSDNEETNSYEAKLHLAEFNGMLRDIIDTHPHIQPSTITGLVRSTTLRYGYPPDKINAGVEKTNSSLYAMKHELAFGSVLYRLPYDIEETDARDDKNGIDWRVAFDNGFVLDIDVKISRDAEKRSMAKKKAYFERTGRDYPKNKLIIYSGFTSEDFTPSNPWRPTESAVDRVLPQVDDVLCKAAGIDGTHATEKVR